MSTIEMVLECDAINRPCSRCGGGGQIEHRAGRSAWCSSCAESADEFEREARDLLTDRGDGRTWADVERDIADALRARAGGTRS